MLIVDISSISHVSATENEDTGTRMVMALAEFTLSYLGWTSLQPPQRLIPKADLHDTRF
jgi:hypothetical protein